MENTEKQAKIDEIKKSLLALNLNLKKIISDVLIKTKSTKPQMESSKAEREKNLLGAFVIARSETTKQSRRLRMRLPRKLRSQ